ncbi:winged helix DNA-binding protein [Marinomonas sp. 15G1-11]|uniref:Winged helix DNA-binding protein n=1 Tax=Marinomonas phaeophyticola TaxID=3004091 RepID=A0ABT4JUH1_9GAMM|nr:winged helix DNA-binding protein [Marinomonas sp. 15G1-11]MCZ2722017.1 winged helix DNA-binding protein [Marinomonas sp. 15G1-11]
MPDKVIVASSHLLSEKGASLSEFEFGMIIANSAFQRWMMHCAKTSGVVDLAPLDILIVHHINHRERSKRLSDICFVLNVEDVHTVNYSVKKLLKRNLIQGEKVGKEMFYRTSEEGQVFCKRYREVREDCLVDSLKSFNFSPDKLTEIAENLRALSGLYDQASREAASL